MTEETTPTPNSSGEEDTSPMEPHRTQPLRPVRDTRTRRPPTPAEHVQPITRQPHPRSQRVRRVSRKARPQDSGFYLPWWSVALMLGAVLIVSFGIVLAVYLLGGSGLSAEPEPIIRIITAEPTLFSPASQSQPDVPTPPGQVQNQGDESSPGSLALEGPTLEAVVFTPTPLNIRVGTQVYVDGVDEQKLNVRDVPGIIDTTVIFRADEDERFEVLDGPTQADGFTWWLIADPANPDRRGWAVSNYLAVPASADAADQSN